MSGSSYVKLPAELRTSKKVLINIKNNNQKCFLCCHVKHLNPVKIHRELITTSLKKIFDAELLFTDTDSLTYEIKSEDIYEEFFKHKHLFDFGNLSKDSTFYDNQNKMVAGKIKIVYRGIPINKFVGLKSKKHSMLSDHDK